MHWDWVMNIVYADIGDMMIDFFETVCRDGEIYSTPTFCRVVALLQQDMRAAP